MQGRVGLKMALAIYGHDRLLMLCDELAIGRHKLREMATVRQDVSESSIPRRLAAIRARSGLNQDQFAARLGFPKRTYLGWERGETEPPIWMLSAVLREFGIDPEWMLQGSEEIPRMHARHMDFARLRQIGQRIEKRVEKLGLKLDYADIQELAEQIYVEPPEAEERLMAALSRQLELGSKGSR